MIKNNHDIYFNGNTSWSKVLFKEIAERVSQSGESGELPYIEFEDIISGEGKLNKDIFQRSTKKIGKKFNQGDVLFGKLRPYLRNIFFANTSGIAVGDFWILRPTGIDPFLLYLLVNSQAFMKVANMSSGSKMPRADWELVSNMEIVIPDSVQSQQSISGFFKSIDSYMAGVSNKLASLKQIKLACLQSMFPQEGESVPKVRFNGCVNEWSKYKIGQIGTFYNGLTGKNKEDFDSGDSFYITFLNVLNNSIINTSLLERVNINIGEHQNEVLKNDILFNTSSETPEEVGMCSVLKEDFPNLYLNSFCFGFRLTTPLIDPLCFTYLMRSHVGRKAMKYLAQGATRYNLSKRNFSEVEIILPSIEEQQKIAAYFENLDHQISLQTQRLEKLKHIKSACLDKMFV